MFKKSLLIMLFVALMAPWAVGQTPYTKVTENKTDWSGTYVIASGSYGATATLSSGGLSEVTMTLSGNNISNLNGAVEWVIESSATSGYYYIKNGNNYLQGSSTTALALGTSPSSAINGGYLWQISYSNSKLTLQTKKSSNTIYMRFNTTYHFMATSSSAYADAVDFYEVIDIYPKPKDVTILQSYYDCTNANISWTAPTPSTGNTLARYEYKYKKSADQGYTEGTLAAEATTQVLTGLTAETTYDYQIQAVYTDGENAEHTSGWYATTFNTGQEYSVPQTWNFDASTSMPECWTISSSYVNSGTTYPRIYNSNSYAHSTSNSLQFYGPSDQQIVVMPAINESLNGKTLSFYGRGASAYNTNTVYIGYYNSSNVFTTIETVSLTGAYTDNPYEVDLANIPNGIKKVAIKGYCSSNYSGLYIDDVTIAVTESCKSVKNLTAGTPASTSVPLSWTAGDAETNWKLQYKVDGSSDWTTVNVSSSDLVGGVYTLSGLTQTTTYNWQVAAWCDTSDPAAISGYVAGANFTTNVACPTPTDLTCTAYTGTTATLGWTSTGADLYEIYLTTDVEDIPDGESTTDITSNTNSKTLEGLTAETTYYAYVRGNCGGDGKSDWSSMLTFTPSYYVDVPIGSGTSSSYYLPSYSYYNYSLTQQLYTPSELEYEGAIRSIAFYQNNSTAKTRTIDIYLVHTDKSAFSSTTDWIAASTEDRVFSGSVTFAANSWTTITFDTPFEYDGRSNLALIVDDNTGSGNSGLYGGSFTSTSNSSLYINGNTNYSAQNPSGYGSRTSSKNRLIVNVRPTTAPRPYGLTTNNTETAHTATVSWTAPASNVVNYIYQYKAGSNEWSAEATVTTTSAALENLAANSEYTFRVKANYGNNNESVWATLKFNTAITCATPTALVNTTTTASTATFTWTKGDSETAWQLAYSTTSGFDPDAASGVIIVDINDDDANLGYVLESTNAHPLTAETTYYARIRAVCDENSSWNSDEVEFTPTAAQTLTVYDDTDKNEYLPIECYYADYALRGQFIIPASDLTAMNGKLITKMRFYADYNFSLTGTFEVLVKGIGETATLTAFIDTGDAITVYNGTICTSSNEVIIEFAEEYPYYGDNLLIAIQQEEGGNYASGSSAHIKYYGKNVDNIGWQGHGNYSTSTMASITGSSKSFAPKTTFTYLPNPYPAPMNLVASNVGATTATLSWSASPGSTPTKYQYQYKAGAGEFTAWTDNASTSVDLENLTPETLYTFNLRAVYAGGNSTEVSTTFTTDEACPAPTDLVLVSRPAAHPSWLEISWTSGASSWNVYYREAGAAEWGDAHEVNTNSYTIEGAYAKTYEVKVASVCDNAEGNAVEGTFSTPIDVTIADTFTETFDQSTCPAGWTAVDGVHNNTNYSWTFSNNYGSYAASANYSSTSPMYLVTPILHLSDLTPILTFNQTRGSGTNTNAGNIYVKVSTTGTSIADFTTTVWSGSTADLNTATFTETKVDLTAYSGQDVYIAFFFSGTAAYAWRIQDVTVNITNTFMTEGNWNDEDNWTGNVPSSSDNVIVAAAATVPSNTTATANNITLGTGGSLTIANGGQLYCTNSVQATVKKAISHWTGDKAEKADSDGWYAISSPIDDIEISSFVPVAPYKWNVYRYDEPTAYWNEYRSDNTEEPHLDGFDKLDLGRGYLYRSTLDGDIEFEGAVNAAGITYPLSFAYDGNVQIKGFNLVGNPFTHEISLSDMTFVNAFADGFYLLEEADGVNKGKWITSTSTTKVAPMQAFLVQATGADASIAIANNDPTPIAGKGTNYANDNIMFMVKNAEYSDEAYVLFKKGHGLNKIDHRNAEIPMLYVINNGEEFAIADMPDNTSVINLGFEAKTMGQYTISLKAEGQYSYMHLYDKLTGEDIDMLVEDSYTFIGSQNDRKDRFVLNLNYNAAGIDSESDIFAYQNGSDIIVNGEGELQVIDITGRKVMTTTVNGVEIIRGLNSGVYIFRVIGETQRTQKIVVR